MAVQNPSALYSGGQGIFNSAPYTQLALQQEAKKQAKKEALNQYFHDMRGKINDAGARTQDINGDGKTRGIKDDIADWENHWRTNKDDILRGGASQQKNDELYAAIQRAIEKSKGRAKFQLEQGKGVAEGKFDPDEEDIQGVMTHVNKSIYDPTSYKDDGVSEYGWGDLSPAIPDYDVEKKSKVFDAITKGIVQGKKYDYSKMKTNPTTGQAIVPFVKEYSKDQIKSIAESASEIPSGNSELAKSARKHYQKILDSPEYLPDLEKLDKAYQSVYGKDAFISNPKQAAAADAILRASVLKEEAEEQEINYAQREQSAINKIYISQAGRGSRNEPATLSDYDVFKNYEPKYETKKIVTKKPNWAGIGGESEEITIIKAKEVDATDRKLIGDVNPSYDEKGVGYYKVRPDGDWEGAGGQVISRANAARKNMDATSITEEKRGRLSENITPKNQVRVPKDIKQTKITNKWDKYKSN